MNEATEALSDFFSQPFGAVGAACIMLAVTAINSKRLSRRFQDAGTLPGLIFNGLNLVGGALLFVNATLRSEVVWIVLETYFVIIAAKGLIQARSSEDESSATPTDRNVIPAP